MRNNNMHTLFTRYLDPSISPKVARRVNHVIDNPSQTDKAIYRLFNPVNTNTPRPRQQRMNRTFGPERIGHRIYNHDWIEAITRGYIEAGLEGAKAAVYHNIGDMLSDTTRHAVGVPTRNLLEAGLEFLLSKKVR